MTEVLIALSMAPVFWLGYIRGHKAGILAERQAYFTQRYLVPALAALRKTGEES